MKLYIRQIDFILISVIILVFSGSVSYSQESDNSETTQPKLFIGINAGPSENQIVNKGILSVSGLTSKYNISYAGSFGLGYFFSNFIGLSTGLGYCSYNTEISLSTYSNKFNTTDSENEVYERRISASDLKEIQNISFLNVPLYINFQLPFTRKFGFYIQSGVDFLFPLSKEYQSSGTFTYSGYYPAYNVLFQNLPAYGFPTNAPVNSSGNLELKSYIIDGQANAGFHLFITEKFQIALGVSYSRSLSGITTYTTPENFQLSSDVNQINSLMGGSSQVTTQSLGLRLSLRYYLK